MKRIVRVTSPAYHDLISNHTWWAENRSARQADSWFEGIEAQMLELATNADMHPLATEIALADAGIRQVSFGLGSQPSHRILYAIDGQSVAVLRVRACKQDKITVDDLHG